MKKTNRKGMSIAAVMGILVCLVSLVTTCFLFAVRSSILTSRSLKYIESYNEASTSIDNAVNFLSDQMNIKYKVGKVTGNDVKDLTNSVNGLFGVLAVTEITETVSEVNLETGVIITIRKEYYKVNSTTDYLISVVKFAATTSGGQSLITTDLAFDKGTVVELADMIKTRYNAANLLWNYWSEQRDNADEKEGCDNKLVEFMSSNFVLDNIIADINNWFAASDNYDITTQMTAERLIGVIQNQMEARGNFNVFTGGFETVNDFHDLYKDRWHVSKTFSSQVKPNPSGDKAAIVIDHSVQVNSQVDLVDKEITATKGIIFSSEKKFTRTPLYITNNSVLYLRGGMKANVDIYIERGSTLFVQNGSGITITEYKAEDGSMVAPIFDTDYVSQDVIKNEAKEGTYVGGGAFVKGDFSYKALNGDGIFMRAQRYDHFSKAVKTMTSYFNGNITASGKVAVQYYKEDSKTLDETKLPFGATIFNDNETSFSNLGFQSNVNSVRPALIFTNGSINIKNCSSLIEGKTVKYMNESSWNKVEGKKCGFAIITCEKIKALKGDGNLVFMNMFYNNTQEANNDTSDVNLLNAMNDMQGASGYAKYQIHNGFVNKNVLAGCSDNIERDAVHWNIPNKLRGTMVSASISASQSRA